MTDREFLYQLLGFAQAAVQAGAQVKSSVMVTQIENHIAMASLTTKKKKKKP